MTTSGVPKPYVIFSFGQPWGGERSLSKNLVTMVVTYCRALNDFRVRNSVIQDELLFEAQESKDIRIISPTSADIEAETFLNPGRKSPQWNVFCKHFVNNIVNTNKHLYCFFLVYILYNLLSKRVYIYMFFMYTCTQFEKYHGELVINFRNC